RQEEDVRGVVDVPRDDVGGEAFKGDGAAVGADRRMVGEAVAGGGGGGGRGADPGDCPRHAGGQGRILGVTGVGHCGGQVAGETAKDDVAAVGAEHGSVGGAVAGGRGGRGRVAHQRVGPRQPVVQEQVIVDTACAAGVHLAGHQVRGGAGEDDVTAVGA